MQVNNSNFEPNSQTSLLSGHFTVHQYPKMISEINLTQEGEPIIYSEEEKQILMESGEYDNAIDKMLDKIEGSKEEIQNQRPDDSNANQSFGENSNLRTQSTFQKVT